IKEGLEKGDLIGRIQLLQQILKKPVSEKESLLEKEVSDLENLLKNLEKDIDTAIK
ncbi:MAG: hypothetical protein HQK63_17315, partial [Desulfamplus sp.]|nr:hypothetical protein [Desulfamplus sp.]